MWNQTMNPIAQARNPSLTPEWSDKLQAKLNSYSFWGRTCCYKGGGGTEVKYVDPYEGTGVRDLFKQLTDWIGPQIGQGITPYAGQTVPGVSPLQQAGFGAAGGLTPIATGGMEYFGDILGQADPGAPGRFMGTAEQTLQNVLQPFDPKMLMESLEPARQFGMDIYKQDVMPAIAEKYFSGGEGGAGYRELARGGQRLSAGLGAELASYIYGGSEAQKGRQQAGVGQAMQLAGLPGSVLQQAGQVGGMGTDMLSQMMNIGGQQRGITGEQLGGEYAKWQQAQPWANPYLQQFLGTALGQPPMTPYLEQGAQGLGSQMMPALGAFVGAGGINPLMGGVGNVLGGLGGWFAGGGGTPWAGMNTVPGLTSPLPGGGMYT